jgi:hypothetical protein
VSSKQFVAEQPQEKPEVLRAVKMTMLLFWVVTTA